MSASKYVAFLAPKRADDPLSLRKLKRRRRILAAASIGLTTFSFYHDASQLGKGQQQLRSYIETVTRDHNGIVHRDVIAVATVVFLTSGTTYTRPADWDLANNSVECIGGGQGGQGPTGLCACAPGAGGIGGGYAKSSNLNIAATASYTIGAAGAANLGNGGNTTFNSSAILAAGGGTGTTQVGTVTRAGGSGGAINAPQGGGGGGAAGPNAAGNNGSLATGGKGDGTFGGAGGATGVNGSPGAEFSATVGGTAGSGGGGGGGNIVGCCHIPPGTGGLYGGAGGGSTVAGTGALGAQGFIVISYTPIPGTIPFGPYPHSYLPPRSKAPLAGDQLGYVRASQTKLIGLDKMFGAAGQTKTYDWTNPVRSKAPDYRSFVAASAVHLIGKDAFFGAAGESKTYDYPNPRGKAPLAGDQLGFISPAQTKLIGKDTFFGAAGEVPTFDWTNPVRPLRLPTDQLGFIDPSEFWLVQPFAQNDWPNPIRPRRLLADQLGYIGPSETWLVQPFNQNDWPNPVRARKSSPDQLGWIDPYKLNLSYAVRVRDGVKGNTFKPDNSVAASAQWLGSANALLTAVSVTVYVRPLLKINTFKLPDSSVAANAQWLGSANALLTVVAAPFNQTDWPNPARVRSAPSITWADGYKVNLFAVAAPFNQIDWPNPARARQLPPDQLGYIDPTEIWLAGQDQFFGAPGQAPTYDYPNPRGPKSYVAHNGFVDPYKINLFVTTAPFSQNDWPNPVRARAASYGWVDTYKTNLFVTATPFPFYQTDWPNPVRARTQSYGWLDPYKINLAVTATSTIYVRPSLKVSTSKLPDSSIAVNAQWLGSATSLLTVVAATRVRAGVKGNTFKPDNSIAASAQWLGSATSLLSVPVAAPFKQIDWPNPRGKQHSIDLRTFTASLTKFIGLDQFFGAPGEVPAFDWPNPTRSKPAPAQYVGYSDPYKIGLFQIVFVPFYQTDWPNPVRARPPSIDQKTFINPLSLELLGKDTFFGAAGEPPSPFDWPTPRARIVASNYVGQAESYKLNLYQIFSPFYQNDWPNPRGAARVVNFGHIDQYKHSLYAIAFPFTQTDWPNPQRGPVPPIGQKTFINRAAIQLIGQDQFFGAPGQVPSFDWPNPKGAARTVSHFGFIDTYRIAFYVKPFTQPDWPIPRGPQYPISLKTFTQPIAYQLLGKDTFFGAPGSPPTYDWPNPIRLRRVQQPTSFNTPFNLLLLAFQTGRYAKQVIGQAVRAVIYGRADSSVAVIANPPVTIVGSTLMTVHDPIDFVCGDSWELTGPLNDANGVALNLTGATITWKLDSVDGLTNLLTLSLGSGISVLDAPTAKILVEASAAQTTAIAPGNYIDWLRIRLANGDVFTEWTGLIRAAKNPV